jgi:splicing factor 3B subunit 2
MNMKTYAPLALVVMAAVCWTALPADGQANAAPPAAGVGHWAGNIGNPPGNIGNPPGNIGNPPGNIGNPSGNIGNAPGYIGNPPGNIGNPPTGNWGWFHQRHMPTGTPGIVPPGN